MSEPGGWDLEKRREEEGMPPPVGPSQPPAPPEWRRPGQDEPPPAGQAYGHPAPPDQASGQQQTPHHPAPPYGQQPPPYGQQPPPSGQQPPPYGQQPPSYGQQPPYGQAPPYGQQGFPPPGQPPPYQHPPGEYVPQGQYPPGPYQGNFPPPGYPPGYPPPGYPPPGAGLKNSSKAVVVLVLGIASLLLLFSCFIGFIPAIIALAMAPGARREIATSGGMLGGESLIRAGKICSWVTLGLTLLGVVILIALIAFSVSIDSWSYTW